MKRFSTREVAEIGLVAAAYAVSVHLFAPLSFAAVQFRLGEIIKSIVIFRRHLIWAMAIGVGLANLISPFAGIWELVWMPLMNLAGGYLAWWIGNKIGTWAGAMAYSVWLSAAVAVVLQAAGALPFWPAFGTVFISETILIMSGVPVMQHIVRRVQRG